VTNLIKKKEEQEDVKGLVVKFEKMHNLFSKNSKKLKS
jgi:hypothetical protein